MPRPSRRRNARNRRPAWVLVSIAGIAVAILVAVWPWYVENRLNYHDWHEGPDGLAYRDPPFRTGVARQDLRPGRYAAFLRYRPDWTRIRLDHVVVRRQDAADLARAPQVREIAFEDCSFEPGAIGRLAALPHLDKIRIVGDVIDPSELRSLATIPALASLVLGGRLVDVTSLEAVATVTGLEELIIRRPGLRSADIEPLARLPNLQRLSLANTDVDIEIIPTIRRMPKLRELDLRDTMVEWREGRVIHPIFPDGIKLYGVSEEREDFQPDVPAEKPPEPPAYFDPKPDVITVPPEEPIEVDIGDLLEAVT